MSLDPYAIISSKRYDVLHGPSGRMFLCDKADGSVLDPLGVGDATRRIAMDEGTFYREDLSEYHKYRADCEREKAEKSRWLAETLKSQAFKDELMSTIQEDRLNWLAFQYAAGLDPNFDKLPKMAYHRTLDTGYLSLAPTQQQILDSAFEKFKPMWAPKPVTLTIQGEKHVLIDGRIQPKSRLQGARDRLASAHKDYMNGLRESKPRPSIAGRGSGYEEPEP